MAPQRTPPAGSRPYRTTGRSLQPISHALQGSGITSRDGNLDLRFRPQLGVQREPERDHGPRDTDKQLLAFSRERSEGEGDRADGSYEADEGGLYDRELDEISPLLCRAAS